MDLATASTKPSKAVLGRLGSTGSTFSPGARVTTAPVPSWYSLSPVGMGGVPRGSDSPRGSSVVRPSVVTNTVKQLEITAAISSASS